MMNKKSTRKNSARSDKQNHESDKQTFTSSGKVGKNVNLKLDQEINENKKKIQRRISYFRNMRKSVKLRNIKVVKRSNKLGQALSLPKV